MEPNIRVSNLNVVYPNGYHALHNVSFDVYPGEFLVVIGLSGSGKSTLLRCINRLIEPTSGSILMHGVNVAHIEGEELRKHRANIGMIFQHFNLIKRHSVLNNVLYGSLGVTKTIPALLGRFSKETMANAMQKLEIVGISDKANNRADALSGGQQTTCCHCPCTYARPRSHVGRRACSIVRPFYITFCNAVP